MDLAQASSFKRPRSAGWFARMRRLVACLVGCSTALVPLLNLSGQGLPESVQGMIRQYCFDCHGNDQMEAGLNLEQLTAADELVRGFRKWQQAAKQLESRAMPPSDASRPGEDQRQQMVDGIRAAIAAAAERQAADPGPVVMRHLTSAEYGYAIGDLTGIDLDVERGFSGDAVGGTGFTNTGLAQFVQDSTLEHFLKTARRVADHAVIGAGPLTFHEDPGKTGRELSAIKRIQAVYRAHGFRTAAGEGGKAYGLHRYSCAFYAAWRFHHRNRLNLRRVSLASLAAEEQIDARFAEYIYEVMTTENPSSPTSDIVGRWRSLPIPDQGEVHAAQVRGECEKIADGLLAWQRRFGTNTDAKEEAPVLREDLFRVTDTQPFEMNINWPPGTSQAHVVIAVEPAVHGHTPDVVIIWRRPEIQFRIDDRRLEDPQPLRARPSVARALRFGSHPRGGEVDAEDFVTVGVDPLEFTLPIPSGARSARLLVTAELDTSLGEDCIVRCTIAQLEETDQGKFVSGLLADPFSPAFDQWKAGVLDFARMLPQVSHREPAPSDRDPIPAPFDGSYNNPERNRYHTQIKYHRDDRFLVENILDDATREELDWAWADLLGSFEFHDLWLSFVAEKFDVDLAGRSVADLNPAWISQLPLGARRYAESLHREYHSIQKAMRAAEPGHLEDTIDFAARAWRRPLTEDEEDQLRDYYRDLRARLELEHSTAIRALLTRVLVAPDFIYRAERLGGERQQPLTSWELASRLSFFLWSSLPDEELRRAAENGELTDPAQLRAQAKRMLEDSRSRRFATEFFGQWFGFYRFDQHRGVDQNRFPEFTDSLKAAMYEEAISFFHDMVQNDRPAGEILFADFTFLNQELADHYGVTDLSEGAGSSEFSRTAGADRFHRGGLLRLGAVLIVSSAPLRTSPVRRGDWILRRVLGTHVPPPPADAGSLPPDDVVPDGLSVRQRLDAHRRDPGCVNCHARIDPLGFALEHYDSLGRWRERYRDGKPIETAGQLRDGTRIDGDTGLHQYLVSQQQPFHQTFCTKLLGYALGRGEMIGDLPLLAQMVDHLNDGGGTGGLVERIVASPQFRYHAGQASSPPQTTDPTLGKQTVPQEVRVP